MILTIRPRGDRFLNPADFTFGTICEHKPPSGPARPAQQAAHKGVNPQM